MDGERGRRLLLGSFWGLQFDLMDGKNGKFIVERISVIKGENVSRFLIIEIHGCIQIT